MLANLWLVHPEEEMCAAFRSRFAGFSNVRVVRAKLEDLEPHDCLVTAGNSFGMMTAGVDAAAVGIFGEQMMRRVQHRIMDQFFGEQPVGTAFIEPTGHAAIPFLAHAPTMRMPASIDGTDKVYNATWAALLAIQAHNLVSDQKIETASFPAMGTGFGRVPYERPLDKWRRPFATIASLPTVSIGTSPWNVTSRSITMVASK